MKKKLLALVMGALVLGSVNVMAQSEPKAAKVEAQCTKAKEVKRDCKKGERRDLNPFTGIQLTQEQQAQLDNLRQQRKDQKEEAKKAEKEAKAKNREAFNAEVAKILTPDQFAQYKANCDSLKARKMDGKKFKAREHKGKHDGKGKREGKERRDGKKGPKSSSEKSDKR